MIVCIPITASTHQLGVKWLNQCSVLGGCEDTELVLLAAGNLLFPASAEKSWKKVTRIRDRSTASGWPMEMNGLFVQLSWYIWYSKRQEPWLLADPQLAPIKEGWLAELGQAYEQAGKPFFGDKIPARPPDPEHISPVCILPTDSIRQAPSLVSERRMNLPWFVRGAHELHAKNWALTDLFGKLFVPTETLLSAESKPVVSDSAAAVTTQAALNPVAEQPLPVFSMSELCEVISHNVKSETARKKLMEFLRSEKFHLRDFGTPLKEMVNASP